MCRVRWETAEGLKAFATQAALTIPATSDKRAKPQMRSPPGGSATTRMTAPVAVGNAPRYSSEPFHHRHGGSNLDL